MIEGLFHCQRWATLPPLHTLKAAEHHHSGSARQAVSGAGQGQGRLSCLLCWTPAGACPVFQSLPLLSCCSRAQQPASPGTGCRKQGQQLRSDDNRSSGHGPAVAHCPAGRAAQAWEGSMKACCPRWITGTGCLRPATQAEARSAQAAACDNHPRARQRGARERGHPLTPFLQGWTGTAEQPARQLATCCPPLTCCAQAEAHRAQVAAGDDQPRAGRGGARGGGLPHQEGPAQQGLHVDVPQPWHGLLLEPRGGALQHRRRGGLVRLNPRTLAP